MVRRPAAAVLVAVAVALGAVVAAAPGARARGLDLPPSTLAKLKKEFNPRVKPLGLRVSRGELQNPGTYEDNPQGTHLALYVEPIDADYSDARYMKNFTKLTRAFIPKVFQQWKGLQSFDICQEPVTDPAEVPPPLTQIFVTRDALDRVGNWKTADLTEMLAASPRVRSVAAGYYVYFAQQLRSEPAYTEAAAAAGWTITTTTPATTTPSTTTAAAR